MEMLYILFVLQCIFLFYQSITLRNLKRSLRKVQDKSIASMKKSDARLHHLYFSFDQVFKRFSMPPPLERVPLADETGIVLSVKKIEISQAPTAYNAGLVKQDDGYFMCFRIDTPIYARDTLSYVSDIGSIRLRRDFEPEEMSFSIIDTGSRHAEDARIFQHQDQHYLLFNDLLAINQPRSLCLGALDIQKRRVDYLTSLDIKSGVVEKNWTPFSCEDGIHFLHTINPQKIIKLSDLKKQFITSVSSNSLALDWSKKWGPLRGGTPAQLIDGEYLTFFHSSFEDCKGIRWYVMGACTFEASPPFRMIRISSHPILFKGIYETPIAGVAHPGVRSIYPVGFVVKERGNEEVIHVSCGENDSAIKLVTISKKALFSGFVEIESIFQSKGSLS
ncbi:MAG: hypothetical protein Q8L98_05130 [Chlamydiales bacterium]|nr:hypothetical protein [Chlamydiales bacterium]